MDILWNLPACLAMERLCNSMDSMGFQEPVEQPTRWLIKPKERVRLLLKFFSEDCGMPGFPDADGI